MEAYLYERGAGLYKDHEGKRHSFLDTYDMTELPEMPGAESSPAAEAAPRGKQKNSPF